jgi:hypothetical protein
MLKKVALWKDLFLKCEINPIEPNDDMSLRLLIDMDMLNKKDEIVDFSKKVEK